MGEYDRQRKFPRPICVQFANKAHKEIIMRHIKVLKEKSPQLEFLNISPRNLEKRENIYMKSKNNTQSVILKPRRKVPNSSLQKVNQFTKTKLDPVQRLKRSSTEKRSRSRSLRARQQRTMETGLRPTQYQ